MNVKPVEPNLQQSHVRSMDLDSCKETLRFASPEAMEELVPHLSDSQYEYAKQTLPLKKSKQLEDAWNLFKRRAIKA